MGTSLSTSRALSSSAESGSSPWGGLLNDSESIEKGKVGIVRLDGANYSAPKVNKKGVLGDAAHKATWERMGSEVFYQRAEGYTFTVCKYGPKDAMAEKFVFEKEGIIKIKGKADDPAHLYIPNRRDGPRDQPRKRAPTRTEPWIENGKEIGVIYIYDSETVMKNVLGAVDELIDHCAVHSITSACGFMENIQPVCAEYSRVPCILSSLSLLPLINRMCPKQSVIIVMTANSEHFNENYDELISPEWNIAKSRVQLVGLQDVEGFGDEVAQGTTVDVDLAEENIAKKVGAKIEELQPTKVAAILSECTELPGYTNTLRSAFRVPVFDSVSAANMLLNGMLPRESYENSATYG